MDLYKVTVKGYEFVEDKRKKVRKTYIVEAYSLTDVDATMAEILKEEPDLNDVQILGASLVTINDIFCHEDFYYKSEPKWYKCKVAIIDGDTEKATKNVMLVKATSLQDAVSELKQFMSGTVSDWDSVAAEETNIYDVCRKKLS